MDKEMLTKLFDVLNIDSEILIAGIGSEKDRAKVWKIALRNGDSFRLLIQCFLDFGCKLYFDQHTEETNEKVTNFASEYQILVKEILTMHKGPILKDNQRNQILLDCIVSKYKSVLPCEEKSPKEEYSSSEEDTPEDVLDILCRMLLCFTKAKDKQITKKLKASLGEQFDVCVSDVDEKLKCIFINSDTYDKYKQLSCSTSTIAKLTIDNALVTIEEISVNFGTTLQFVHPIYSITRTHGEDSIIFNVITESGSSLNKLVQIIRKKVKNELIRKGMKSMLERADFS